MNKKTVLAHFGTQTLVASALSIKQASVSKWGHVIPEKQALRIEKLTNGALKYDPALYAKSA
jgi:DNA-binding transcriptional regulator YdaS (Cro superfamily)